MSKLYFKIGSDWEEVVRLRNEIAKLKNYFDVNSNYDSIECISANTGITLKNLNRFLNQEEFSKFSNKFNSSGNIGIDL